MLSTGAKTIEGVFAQVSEGGFISFHYQRGEEVVHSSCPVVGKKEGGEPPRVILVELPGGRHLSPDQDGVWHYYEGGEVFPIINVGLGCSPN